MSTIADVGFIQELRERIGDWDTRFPLHFLAVVLAKLDGEVKVFDTGKTEFVFPRPNGSISRSHYPDKDMRYEPENIGLEQLTYTESHSQVGNLDIGHPSHIEAKQIRQLQQIIWGAAPDALYPSDIHSDQFGLPVTLVARSDSEVIGFVFGFWRRVDTDWQIESQLLGVDSRLRGQNVASYLKVEQAKSAIEKGIERITWTVDPLQVPNAVLNFNKLGGKARKFFPNLYPFSNALNQTPASRLEITWELTDNEVLKVLRTYSSKLPTHPLLDYFEDLQVVQPDSYPQSKHIAIEIPTDWTTLQQTDLNQSMEWRRKTDDLFMDLIGAYAIIAVCFDETKPYLICERE